MNTDALLRLGFSKNERAVYLSLLRSGPASVSEIAVRTGIDRTLCYSVLNKLLDKALIGETASGRSKAFVATDPDKLLSDQRLATDQLEALVPRLKKLMGERPEAMTVRVLKGPEGVRWVFSDFMTQTKEAYLFGDFGPTKIVAPIHLERYFNYLREKKSMSILFSLPETTPA